MLSPLRTYQPQEVNTSPRSEEARGKNGATGAQMKVEATTHQKLGSWKNIDTISCNKDGV